MQQYGLPLHTESMTALFDSMIRQHLEESICTITVTLPDDLLKNSTRYARSLRLSRAAYIRQSLERMNRELRADRLAQASRKVRGECLRVNAEFDAIETAPQAQ